MQLVDTHCHIQTADERWQAEDFTREKWLKAGKTDPGELITTARAAGVTRLLCVGTTLADSEKSVDLVKNYENVWATIGLHPHEARTYTGQPELLDKFAALATAEKVVAIGECGLDYFYEHSPRDQQKQLLTFQLRLAQEHDLPLVFHVRDAFDDFWPIFDQYLGLTGVIHSFSATEKELEQVLARGLYVGLNGIMTFTKDQRQLTAARAVPLDKLLLETDAPFLTPTPYRGTICEPSHVAITADFLSRLRGETLEELAAATTRNALGLFNLR